LKLQALVACSCLVFQYINENFVDEKHCIINLIIAKMSLIFSVAATHAGVLVCFGW
jgi:hypothetical protein